MRMHTSMGERAAVVSGGQSQRIRIAQALVRDPRIVFLDEATNWLDRKNQAALMEGIRNSTATRVVVAHRIRGKDVTFCCFAVGSNPQSMRPVIVSAARRK